MALSNYMHRNALLADAGGVRYSRVTHVGSACLWE